jgi:hypothetical protein
MFHNPPSSLKETFNSPFKLKTLMITIVSTQYPLVSQEKHVGRPWDNKTSTVENTGPTRKDVPNPMILSVKSRGLPGKRPV